MKNIELYVPQLSHLITLTSNYSPKTESIKDLEVNDFTLKKLFDYHGSDKGNIYYPLYTNVLEKVKNRECLRLLEIGLGTNDPNLISTMGSDGRHRCGGSLRAFRDYLPNAFIFGADVDRACLFSEQNIETYFVDQLDFNTFADLYNRCGGTNFDILIDDGLHSIGANLNTLIFGLNAVNSGGAIIIEDIPIAKIQGYQIVDFILRSNTNHCSRFIKYNNDAGFIYMINIT